MRFKVIAKLAQLNLIYSLQASQVDIYRRKQADRPGKKLNITRKILSQYFFGSLLYLFLFGFMSFAIPFEQLPDVYTRNIGLFLVMGMFQGFLTMYNVFYESKDLQSYRNLPFTELEVIVGKSAVVLLSSLMFLLPILLYLVVIHIRFGNPIWWSLPLSILEFALLIAAAALLILLAVHFLTKTSIFRKHKKVASGLIMGVTIVGTIFATYSLQSYSISFAEGELVSTGDGFLPLWVFYGIAENPLSVQVLLHLLAWIVAVVGLFFFVKTKVLPNFYEAALATSTAVNKAKKIKVKKQSQGQKTWQQQMFRYHLGLLADPTMVFTFMVMPAMLMLFMVGPSFLNFGSDLGHLKLDAKFLSMAVIVGASYGFTSVGGLSTIVISLDRENFNFFKTLPFDMAAYMKFKFWFAYAMDLVTPSLILLGLSLVLRLPIYLMLAAWVALAIVGYIMCLYSFARDHRLLELNWQNVTQLANRGMGNLAKGFILLGSLIVMIILIAISFFFTAELSTAANIGIALAVLVLLIIGAGLAKYFSDKYWKKQIF